MRLKFWCVAALALGLPGLPAVAQDIMLTSRDGSLSVEGTLQGYDGEFYRIETSYGTLTVDGQGVLCDGPGCPDLIAPFAEIRLTGAPEAGRALLLPLWQAFASQHGYDLISETAPEGGFSLGLADPASGRPIGRISFAPAPAPDARAALAEGRAELALTFRAEEGAAERVVGLDALVPVIAPDNPLPRISTTDLARALTGQIVNWTQIGGPDMPVVLHALSPEASLEEALEARLGNPIAATEVHPDPASLAKAVAADPYALAITALSAAGGARVLPLTDSCGFPLEPSRLALKAGDYPLSLPVFLQSPRRRLPLLAREFLEFLTTPEAQAVVTAAGFTDRLAERQPMTADGLRLINAIRGAGDETTLADLQRLVDVMAGADRLSLTFRFEDGSATMDAQSQDNLTELARLLSVGTFRNLDLVLAGFSDGAGSAGENMELSRKRVEVVAAALALAAPDLPPGQTLPRVEAFGEALPIACDTTSGGRRLNRRVEFWLRPMAPGIPGDDTAPTDTAQP